MEANVPNAAAEAVLKPSAPVSDDAIEVTGLDFNQHKTKPITVEELIQGMSGMGFQASAVAEAVDIINDMVHNFCPKHVIWFIVMSRGAVSGLTSA